MSREEDSIKYKRSTKAACLQGFGKAQRLTSPLNSANPPHP
jgi:hypothetical protein